MREFKFRIWDKPVEIMYQDSGRFYVTADGEVYDVNDDFNISDQVVLMQYTGLKDKNGKEIYEGDIVHANDPFEGGSGEVKFEHGSYYIDFGDLDYVALGEYEQEDLEVISNIYED